MGIKIPGLDPTRRLPCGAQQIRCTCGDRCSNLYISSNRKQSAEASSWRQVQHFSACPRLNPTKSGVVWKPRWWRAGSRWGCEREQRWMLNSLARFEWHCWICFGVSQSCKSNKRREGMRMKGGNKGGISPMPLCGGLATRGRRISCKVGPWGGKSVFFDKFHDILSEETTLFFIIFPLSSSVCCLCFQNSCLVIASVIQKQTPPVCPLDSGDLHSTTATSSPTPSRLCREYFQAIHQPFSWSPSALTPGSVSLHPLHDNDLITTASARRNKLYSDT